MTRSTHENAVRANVAEVLQLSGGFRADERARIVARLAPLDAPLGTWRAESVSMTLAVKDRDRRDQHVTAEVRIARLPRVVATSTLPDLDAALAEVREELRRQIDEMATRREPRHNRRLRESRNSVDAVAATATPTAPPVTAAGAAD